MLVTLYVTTEQPLMLLVLMSALVFVAVELGDAELNFDSDSYMTMVSMVDVHSVINFRCHRW